MERDMDRRRRGRREAGGEVPRAQGCTTARPEAVLSRGEAGRVEQDENWRGRGRREAAGRAIKEASHAQGGAAVRPEAVRSRAEEGEGNGGR
ncbi:hypothetical protein C2845_PM17G02790 [Panicum miliaceum]|uniref:Uncharacterized protein n=1 Tax=Panicum miliaceum TaxID=4540 RepID=A0A3L6PZG2_PANMI|nr:hypothetical protein C2845_PM17G02790 [Panicum miliaceum]